eukprot:CAMPEP_0119551068 /NCGR_PEP_ID=MMETSP1352-20130426/4443_1 /TAXON_ID=265584 /ORGANISM="Stauroneis constricta, Strain CCMP1120" /LENGTH=645 /DNA_ID=CAMNT_0007597077 /DNA_START=215 /DNA_END=2152 /DNA_ORIENTATION=-
MSSHSSDDAEGADDPFLIVRPEDDNKKMSTYFKKQQLPNPGPNPETNSNGTTSTRSTSKSHASSSVVDGEGIAKAGGRQHQQRRRKSSAGSLVDVSPSRPSSNKDLSASASTLEFSDDPEADGSEGQMRTRERRPGRRSSKPSRSKSYAEDSEKGRLRRQRQRQRHQIQAQAQTSRQRQQKPQQRHSHPNPIVSPPNVSPKASRTKSFDDSAFCDMYNDSYQDIGDSMDLFGVADDDALAASVSNGADGFASPDAFGGFLQTANHDSNSSFDDEAFSPFDDSNDASFVLDDDDDPGQSEQHQAKGSSGWQKREAWKHNSATRPPSSRRERGVTSSRNPPRRNPSSDEMTVSSARSNASARSKNSTSTKDSQPRTRPRRRATMSNSAHSNASNDHSAQAGAEIATGRARRRASIASSRMKPGSTAPHRESASPASASPSAAPSSRHRRRVPPSRNRSMDEGMFEQRGLKPATVTSAAGNRLPRSGRRASLGMSSSALGNKKPEQKSTVSAADPRPMQMNYPSSTEPKAREWVQDRSESQQKIVNMYKFGETSMSSLQSDLPPRPQSLGSIDINMDDLSKTLEKHRDAKSSKKASAEKVKASRRSSITSFITQKKSSEKGRQDDDGDEYNHRSAEGRDRRTLLDRIA